VAKKTHEKMLTISDPKRNANQNHTKEMLFFQQTHVSLQFSSTGLFLLK
jgi:hypothetical protein